MPGKTKANEGELDEEGEIVDIGLTGDDESDEDVELTIEEIDAMITGKERKMRFKNLEMTEFEVELALDDSSIGKSIYFLYKIFKCFLSFEVHLVFFVCLLTNTLAQVVFFADSNNISQSAIVGLFASLIAYSVLMILYLVIYQCGYSVHRLTKKKYLAPGNPGRVLYFVMLVLLLAAASIGVVEIHRNCFDEHGNYITKEVDQNQTVTYYYCNIKEVIHTNGFR